MSYQAITDIIVNQSQLQDFQLSVAVKDSPQQPSLSFSDILASFNSEESKVEQPKEVEAEKVKEPDLAEKAEKTGENQVKEEKKAEKTPEAEAEKEELKDSEQKIDDKKEKSAELITKTDAESKINEESEGVKKAAKDVKDVKKEKKLSEKDFSRLDQLSKNTESDTENAKLNTVSQKLLKTDEKISVKNKDEDDIELKVQADSSSQFAVNEKAGNNKSDNFNFDFSGDEKQNKKQFALDKDGKITVEDQRTKVKIDTASESKKSALKTSDIKLTNDNTAVMTVELNPNAEADLLSLNNQTAASAGSNFQAMLSNQLSNVAPEFVKAGNLILKDNNQGTINLVLHPDDLGNVKIHLSLDGKTLSGHITVATKEALQVFKDNAETLREAFIKNGFDAASFDVAMNNGGSFNQNMGFNGQDDGTSLFAKRAYGSPAGGLSAELDDIFDNVEDISNYSVNIVA